jgi:hypothetical protein
MIIFTKQRPGDSAKNRRAGPRLLRVRAKSFERIPKENFFKSFPLAAGGKFTVETAAQRWVQLRIPFCE